MKKIFVALAMTAALSLTACAGESTTADDVRDYDTYSDVQEEESPSVDAQDVLQIAWDSLPDSEQEAICDGWPIIPEEIITIIRDGHEAYLTRSDVRTFLDGKC